MLRQLPAPPASSDRIIVMGASTGGVEALHRVLASFPSDCPATILVQHMRPGFVESFVSGLNRHCAPEVVLAEDRQIVKRGRIHVAPAGNFHLIVTAHPVATLRLVDTPAAHGHRPAVDPLFFAAARLQPPPVAALLTGMGRDGAEGLLRIRHAGGHTIAQDEASSTIYGMPRVARDLGAALQILPLHAIAAAVLQAAAPPSPGSHKRTI